MTLIPFLISLMSGLGAGVLSGLFGVGGGTLVVPMLMLQGASIHQAVAMSLVYILFTSLSGSYVYWRKGQIVFRTVLVLALSASLTVYLGVMVSRHFAQSMLAWLFAGFMLFVLALFSWKERLGLNQRPGAAVSPRKRWLSLVGTGLLAGLIASILGVGGGLIMVPLLVLLCGEELKQATCLSLAGVSLIAGVGILQHALFGELFQGLALLGPNLLMMSLAGVAGAPLGIQLNRKLPEQTLRIGFVSLCLCVMVYMLFKTR